VVTLSGGHGIVTGKVDVYWVGGMRYGMDATVTDNSCAIDGGAGDNLPSEAAAVIVDQQEQYDVGFDGDNLVAIAMYCSRRGSADFQDSGGSSLFHYEFGAGEVWQWNEDSGTTCPIAGNPVAKVMTSNGESAGTNTQKLVALYDA
jgi:hypothetical protein